ncbi:MAG TPA: hypothetical protein DEG69_14475 [Flavobacteriaceae bacterium]|nr:hypothetical protein [Flavobacteriaceae bacterium]
MKSKNKGNKYFKFFIINKFGLEVSVKLRIDVKQKNTLYWVFFVGKIYGTLFFTELDSSVLCMF